MSKPKSSVKKKLAVQADPFAPKTPSHAALEAVSLRPLATDVTDEPFFSRDSFVEEDVDDDDFHEVAHALAE